MKIFIGLTPRVIKVESLAYFLDIALSSCALHLCPTSAPMKASQKLDATLYAMCLTFMKLTRVKIWHIPGQLYSFMVCAMSPVLSLTL